MPRLTTIDGIGEKTAERLEDVGVNLPRDAKNASAGELADRAGISRERAAKVIRAGGGKAPVRGDLPERPDSPPSYFTQIDEIGRQRGDELQDFFGDPRSAANLRKEDITAMTDMGPRTARAVVLGSGGNPDELSDREQQMADAAIDPESGVTMRRKSFPGLGDTELLTQPAGEYTPQARERVRGIALGSAPQLIGPESERTPRDENGGGDDAGGAGGFVDDRARQSSLTDLSAEEQASRDRETRVDTGASDTFADDRNERGRGGPDSGEQAGLFEQTEEMEGQAALGGGTATRTESEGFFSQDGGGAEGPPPAGALETAMDTFAAETPDKTADLRREVDPGDLGARLSGDPTPLLQTVTDRRVARGAVRGREGFREVVSEQGGDDRVDEIESAFVEFTQDQFGDAGGDTNRRPAASPGGAPALEMQFDATPAAQLLAPDAGGEGAAVEFQGPTSRRPIPDEERQRALQGTGLAPGDTRRAQEAERQSRRRQTGDRPDDLAEQLAAQRAMPSLVRPSATPAVNRINVDEADPAGGDTGTSVGGRATFDPVAQPSPTPAVNLINSGGGAGASTTLEFADSRAAQAGQLVARLGERGVVDVEDQSALGDVRAELEGPGEGDAQATLTEEQARAFGAAVEQVGSDLPASQRPQGFDLLPAPDELSEQAGGATATDDTASSGERIEQFEFGSRDLANEARDDIPPEAMTGRFDRRNKTVEVDVTELSDRGRRQLESAAARSFADEEVESPDFAELSESERASLASQSESWSWQKYGFEAMRAKSALRSRGVKGNEWLDYYDPGESWRSSVEKLDDARERAARGRGATGIDGERTDSMDERLTRGGIARNIEQQRGDLKKLAREGARQGDEEAISVLVDEFDVPEERARGFVEQTESEEERVAAVEAVVARVEANGRFTTPPPKDAPKSPGKRGRASGQYVGDEIIEPADPGAPIQRDPETGEFFVAESERGNDGPPRGEVARETQVQRGDPLR